MMREQKVSAVDQSAAVLPEEIIHHIFSFLPSTREAAKTCVLSKCWLRAWISYLEGPSLVFIEETSSNSDRTNKFYKFVDNTMSKFVDPQQQQRIGPPIQRFVLESTNLIKGNDNKGLVYPLFDKWINIAMMCNHVQEMTLLIHQCICHSHYEYFVNGIITDHDPSLSYQVPERILDKVRSLTLRGSTKICRKTRIPAAVSINYLSSLRSLTLSIMISSLELERILKGCPFLENLSIDSTCWDNLPRIKIMGVDHLKTLDLRLDKSKPVQIDAPNLESFLLYFSGGKNPSSPPSIDNCLKLKYIDFSINQVDAEWLHKFLPKLAYLETFKLSFWRSSKSQVVISNPWIKNIILHDGLSRSAKVIVDAPRLSFFKYNGMMRQYEDAGPFVKNPPHSCRADLTVSLNPHYEPNWLSKLREMIIPFSCLTSLSLTFYMKGLGGRDKFEVGRMLLLSSSSSSTVEVERLNIDVVDVCATKSSVAVEAVLSELLSICHPSIITVATSFLRGGELGPYRRDVFKLGEMLENREKEVKCRCSGHVECWKHQLKEVEIDQDESNIKEWCPLYCYDDIIVKPTICFKLKW